MAFSVLALFAGVNLPASTPLPWRQRVAWDTPGVYVLTLSPNPDHVGGMPKPDNLPPEVGARWLDDETVIYIGKAGGPKSRSTLKKRLGQFYRHRWGKDSPHNGGQDVHLLNYPIWIFAAPTPEPRQAESAMIAAFKANVGRRPFANRQD